MRGTETVTVVRKPRPDKLKPTPAVEEQFDIEKCIVWPRASNEEGKGWIQISGQNVFCPPGSDVKAEDQMLVRGLLYSVEGVPGEYRKKGKTKGLLVTLERVA